MHAVVKGAGVLHQDGRGYTLQRTNRIANNLGAGEDHAGSATDSPRFTPLEEAACFRLRGPPVA